MQVTEWQAGRELLRRSEVVAVPPAPFSLRTLNQATHRVYYTRVQSSFFVCVARFLWYGAAQEVIRP